MKDKNSINFFIKLLNLLLFVLLVATVVLIIAFTMQEKEKEEDVVPVIIEEVQEPKIEEVIPSVVEEKSYIDILKDNEMDAPEILKVYSYESEPIYNVRNVMYELEYDEFIEKLAAYKEEDTKRFYVFPEAAFTIDSSEELYRAGYPIYSDLDVSKWAFSEYYSQGFISLFCDVDGYGNDWTEDEDLQADIRQYCDWGEYVYPYLDYISEFGPFINLEERTIRLRVRYRVLDAFTGDSYYSDYSDTVLYGKDAPEIDPYKTSSLRFSNNLKVESSKVLYLPDFGTGDPVPYLRIKLSGYEEELDKCLDKFGYVAAQLDILDNDGFIVDEITFNLAYIDNGYIEYTLDNENIDFSEVDLSNVKCKVKLVYVSDPMTNLNEFSSETSWIEFSCK